MNTLIEQTVRFLSRSNSPYIHEKSLTPDEIVANRVLIEEEICTRLDGCPIVNNVCVDCLTELILLLQRHYEPPSLSNP